MVPFGGAWASANLDYSFNFVMKYFVKTWIEASGNRKFPAYCLDLSEGSYAYIIQEDLEWVWEVIFQDEQLQWRELVEEEDTLEKAKMRVEQKLLDNGYRAIEERMMIML